MAGTIIKTDCGIEIMAFDNRLEVGKESLFFKRHTVCSIQIRELTEIVNYVYDQGAKDKEAELVDRMQKVLLGKIPII